MTSSPSGLQVSVLYKSFGSRLYGTSQVCASAWLPIFAGGYLALRLVSTAYRFGTSTSPISTAISTARLAGGNQEWQERFLDTLPPHRQVLDDLLNTPCVRQYHVKPHQMVQSGYYLRTTDAILGEE